MVMVDSNRRDTAFVLQLDKLRMNDIALVGGKNASLGEMIGELTRTGVRVPGGFATTSRAYRQFLSDNGLESRIRAELEGIDVSDMVALRTAAQKVREMVLSSPLPDALVDALSRSYIGMGSDEYPETSVAVRSSATAEDLPDASFAGQQETFLNVCGIDALLDSVRRAYSSLFTERAIVYRTEHGFDHMQVALSAGVQRMVRSDIGVAGVAFTLDTESGFDQVVLISAAYGLGETVVQGSVNPDEYYVYKPSLADDNRPAILSRQLGSKAVKMVYEADVGVRSTTRLEAVSEELQNRFALSDDEIESLARQAVLIEAHYKCPMDIEWAKDGEDNNIYILQARPETVHSRSDPGVLERYRIAPDKAPIISGHAVGKKVGSGKARVIETLDALDCLEPGEVLVADQTDPDWGPVLRRASAVVTNRGGRACHAAIVAREMGIPALVGCGDATKIIPSGEEVTVSCAEGEVGHVYPGKVPYKVDTVYVKKMPPIPVKLMINLANPWQAFSLSGLPNAGVGLARVEFIINRMIGIHPRAALEFESLSANTRAEVMAKCVGYTNPVEYYVRRLAEGISLLAAAFAPNPVIVRTSDFKSNEYAHLVGGAKFEPKEENPMLGYRGAARYLSQEFRKAFELECRALKYVRDEMGLTNVEVMIPFLRTVEEARQVTGLLADNGLERGVKGLRLIMMCEIPSNVILADEFLEYFDGYSIGSNDLTQLTLGVDRDSELLANLFDERNPAVLSLIRDAIRACHRHNRYIGICGQGPSDYPDFARWLVDEGIDSLSLTPDTLIDTWLSIADQQQPFNSA